MTWAKLDKYNLPKGDILVAYFFEGEILEAQYGKVNFSHFLKCFVCVSKTGIRLTKCTHYIDINKIEIQ